MAPPLNKPIQLGRPQDRQPWVGPRAAAGRGVAAPTRRAVTIPESDVDRLLEAAYRSLPLMPEEIRERVAELLTPEAMATLAGVAAVWGASHFVGIGEVVDILFAGATVIFLGWDVIRALKGFVRYYDRAVHAHSDKDIDVAAGFFADAMITAINAIGWGKLTHWLGNGAGRAARAVRLEGAAAKLARWRRYIDAIDIRVPPDRGMLWSSLGDFRTAEKLAQRKGLVSLESILKKNGFFQLYSKEFGKTQNKVTGEIWKMVSRKYAQSLHGKVVGYVHRATHYQKINRAVDPKMINAMDPVIVHEVDEISKILLSNPRITELTLIDVQTGEAFGYRSKELLESLLRLQNKSPRLPHLPE